jgi:beta-glucosidase
MITTEKNNNLFKKKFLWGASTASHQVEGRTINQWSVWELENAHRLASKVYPKLKKLSNWEDIEKHVHNPSNYVSGEGVDHYNRFKEDFKLLEGLNFNSFRFGIEWSRIEPAKGKWNQDEINHYHEYIDELIKRDIKPIMNIWHWTMPVWFTDEGGFTKAKNLKYFEEFVKKITDEYGSKLEYIITLNEPNVYASCSYLTGVWPPQDKNLVKFVKVFYNLSRAHKKAYRIIKKVNPSIKVGIANQVANIQAKRPHNLFDELSTKWMRYFWNWWFYERIRNYQDFVGMNYYFTDYYTGKIQKRNPEIPLSDTGWYMEPEGLYPIILRAWTRFKKPIIITENGVADSKDEYRQWWIDESILAMERALSEGVELDGYMHWSLLDNFEWDSGWWPKFGLIEVDRANDMKRTVRPSATYFAKRIKDLQLKRTD